MLTRSSQRISNPMRYTGKWKNYVVITWVKLNIKLDGLVIYEQPLFIQLWSSNIGGVIHAQIIDKQVLCDELFNKFIHRRDRSACECCCCILTGAGGAVAVRIVDTAVRVTVKIGFPSIGVS